MARVLLGGGRLRVTRQAQFSSQRRKFMKFTTTKIKASTIHTVLTLVWVALVLPTLLWWRESVFSVALMSLWANIASHWSAREAARAKEKTGEGFFNSPKVAPLPGNGNKEVPHSRCGPERCTPPRWRDCPAHPEVQRVMRATSAVDGLPA